MKIKMPPSVNMVIDSLHAKGFEAYAVGGCVRDTILAREPDDWDITTSASPQQVKEIFDRTVDTGLEHGTVTVLAGSGAHEVTTYRIDGEYEDGRHPKEVVFTSSLAEDLRRRDFTINAMAYNDAEGLIDVFDGIADLKKGVIRCVGDPMDRFGEDALRMLRAVRFAAQLGFSIEEKTRGAIISLAPNLSRISTERVQTELVKLLVSAHPEEMRTVYETGISKVILPEFDAMMEEEQRNPHHCYTVGEHTIHAMCAIRPDKVLRLTMLFHDVAKPVCRTVDEKGIYHYHGHPAKGAQMAHAIFRRLKFDCDTMDRVCRLITWHDDNPPLDEASVRKAVHRAGIEQYPALFLVKRADILAKSKAGQKEKLAYVDAYERMYEEIRRRGDCLTLKELAVSGKDLIGAGIKPGKQIGEILNTLLALVLEDPQKNTKEYLMSYTLKNLFI